MTNMCAKSRHRRGSRYLSPNKTTLNTGCALGRHASVLHSKPLPLASQARIRQSARRSRQFAPAAGSTGWFAGAKTRYRHALWLWGSTALFSAQASQCGADMSPPFTTAQFLGVFQTYNAAIWPLQVVMFGLALIAIASIWGKWPIGARLVPAILGTMWAINSIGYHYSHFRVINPAATLFAAIFLVQASLLGFCAATRGHLQFAIKRDGRTFAGFAIIIYAVAIYPILGMLAGHGLMKGPMLGVAPCPTTIFTIGILVLARGKWVAWLSIIPILWSLIGWLAAFQLGMSEDFGLPIAAATLLGTNVSDILSQRRNPPKHL